MSTEQQRRLTSSSCFRSSLWATLGWAKHVLLSGCSATGLTGTCLRQSVRPFTVQHVHSRRMSQCQADCDTVLKGRFNLVTHIHATSHEPALLAGTDQRFKRLRVDGRDVGVSVWDTAGQDRFQSLTPFYYRGAQGVVFGEQHMGLMCQSVPTCTQ